MMKHLLLITVLAITIFSCGVKAPEKETFGNWPDGVTYEIFVQSFSDSDGDGIGDFNGMAQKLDYLEELGVEAVWLMPISPSPSYHKYDVTDYKAVHPDYGTIDEFKNFVAEAHERDIKVIIDLVINHSASAHPWFKKASSSPDNPFRDYYVWADKDSIIDQLAKKEISLDSDNITQWHAPNGDTTAEHYYGFFWAGMPDLNFDNPKVREEVYEIGRFWLEEVNVDGFRLDAAKHIYPDERAEDSHAFWIEFREKMESINPDVYLIGEVWADAATVAPYLKGLPALFNFDLGYAITSVVNAEVDTIDLVEKYKEINDYYLTITEDFINATFLKNHDQNRIMSEVGNNPDRAKMAAAILLTLPGSPYLYYGEEIGMKGSKPDPHIREPFLWDYIENDPSRTNWTKPKHSTDEAVTPLATQVDDPNSLYNFYKELINLRRQNKILSLGSMEIADLQNNHLVSFIRKYGNEQLLVIHNISGEDQQVDLPEGMDIKQTIYQSKEAELKGGSFNMPPYSTVIVNL